MAAMGKRLWANESALFSEFAETYPVREMVVCDVWKCFARFPRETREDYVKGFCSGQPADERPDWKEVTAAVDNLLSEIFPLI